MLALLAVSVVAACSDSSSSSSDSTEPTTTAPAEKEATADLVVVGGGGQSGALVLPTVSCQFPTNDGLSISVLGPSPVNDQTIRVTVVDGKTIDLRLSAGSDQTYTERDFRGSGVADFDPKKGFTVDSRLTEVTPATTNKGTLGSILSIKGTVECNDQKPGLSSVRIIGGTDLGGLDTTLDPVRVTCSFNSSNGDLGVQIVGIGTVGGSKLLMFVATGNGKINFGIVPKTGAARFYTADAPEAATFFSQYGVHINGEADESGSTDTTVKRHVRMSGDAVCGATTFSQ